MNDFPVVWSDFQKDMASGSKLQVSLSPKAVDSVHVSDFFSGKISSMDLVSIERDNKMYKLTKLYDKMYLS